MKLRCKLLPSQRAVADIIKCDVGARHAVGRRATRGTSALRSSLLMLAPLGPCEKLAEGEKYPTRGMTSSTRSSTTSRLTCLQNCPQIESQKTGARRGAAALHFEQWYHGDRVPRRRGHLPGERGRARFSLKRSHCDGRPRLFSLRRVKDVVSEVPKGLECGVGLHSSEVSVVRRGCRDRSARGVRRRRRRGASSDEWRTCLWLRSGDEALVLVVLADGGSAFSLAAP